MKNTLLVLIMMIGIIIIRALIAVIAQIAPLWLSLSAVVVIVSAVIGWNI